MTSKRMKKEKVFFPIETHGVLNATEIPGFLRSW